MRSFNPDVRRTKLEPVDSLAAVGAVVVSLREAPFDDEDFGVVFFSSTSRPRCFV